MSMLFQNKNNKIFLRVLDSTLGIRCVRSTTAAWSEVTPHILVAQSSPVAGRLASKKKVNKSEQSSKQTNKFGKKDYTVFMLWNLQKQS